MYHPVGDLCHSLKSRLALPPIPEHDAVLAPLANQERQPEHEISRVLASRQMHKRVEHPRRQPLGSHLVQLSSIGDVAPQVEQQLEQAARRAADAEQRLVPEVDAVVQAQVVRHGGLLGQDDPALSDGLGDQRLGQLLQEQHNELGGVVDVVGGPVDVALAVVRRRAETFLEAGDANHRLAARHLPAKDVRRVDTAVLLDEAHARQDAAGEVPPRRALGPVVVRLDRGGGHLHALLERHPEDVIRFGLLWGCLGGDPGRPDAHPPEHGREP